MSITAEIRTQITQAMKSGDEVRKNILRFILGQVQALESKGTVTDQQVIGLINQTIDKNQQVIDGKGDVDESGQQKTFTASPEIVTKLQAENEVLRQFVPTLLSEQEIRSILSQDENLTQIKQAKSAGQATGICLKVLKAAGCKEGSFNGNTVKGIAAELYAQ